MARRRRYFLPNVPLHLIQRGNNRHACFFTDRDYAVYLSGLKKYSQKYNVAIHAYVLMTNHVHLLMTPTTATGASQLMQALGAYYVQYINKAYQRSGTLWEGRFRASLVDSVAYLLTVSRYIELNPVRAGMVDHPAAYPGSSYRANALGKPNKLLTPHSIYQGLGDNPGTRCANYSALFDHVMTLFSEEEIRKAANKGWVLGDERFKAQIEEQLGYPVPPLKRGGARRRKKKEERRKKKEERRKSN